MESSYWLDGRQPKSTKLESGAVILLSGGLDSAVVTGMAIRDLTDGDNDRVIGLFFDYGQLSLEAELVALKWVADHFQIAVMVVKVNLRGLTKSSLLGDGDVAEQASTFVPGRNVLFSTYAAVVAYTYQCYYIGLGVTRGEYSIYPDSTPEFATAMELVLRLGMGYGVALYAPLINLEEKAEVIRFAEEMGIKVYRTVSCYNAKVVTFGKVKWFATCGKCSSCIVRRECVGKVGVDVSNKDAIRSKLRSRRA